MVSKATILSLFLVVMCYLARGQGELFQEVGASVGLQGERGYSLFGMGCSFVDFNGDGWDDITIATGEGLPILFFQNDQEGGFDEIPSPIENADEVKMILWVDYDNDGDQDLYFTCFEKPNRLYQNQGGFQFLDVTEAAGFDMLPDLSWGAAWADYDRDGWLDLYYVNRDVSSHTNYFYRNKGDGTFENLTDALDLSDGYQLTFCPNFLDFNKDQWPDLYLANDKIFPNTMWRNKTNGGFDDVSGLSGTGIKIDAMNIDAADYDNDGDLDIYVTNTNEYGNVLLHNYGNENFSDVAGWVGVRRHAYCWAGLFFDFDNDGDQDLYVCNQDAVDTLPNILYENLMDGDFEEAHPDGFPGDTFPSFSACIGDYNRDGRLDILVPMIEASPIYLWENKADENQYWLSVKLIGTTSNSNGIGAWIELYTPNGNQVRYTHCGQGYLSQNSYTQHFGLGASPEVDSLVVRWPSGAVSFFDQVPVNDFWQIEEQEMPSSVLENAPLDRIGFPFPNPAYNHVFVPGLREITEPFRMSLTNSIGQVWELAYADESEPFLKLPNVPSGMYYLHISVGNHAEVRTIMIKQRK